MSASIETWILPARCPTRASTVKVRNYTFGPPLRHSILNLDVLMPGEPQPHEPLLVEQPRCLFQQLNPPPVVFNQVVVGGEDVPDSFLCCSVL